MKIFRRILSMTIAAAMLGTVLIPPTGAAESAQENTMYDLTTNYRSAPLGVDTTPTFAWKLKLDGFNRAQSAYRITVADSAEKAAAQDGNVWDSQKQAGENNYNIEYKGAALKSQTVYYWTVEAWDETGASVGVSEPARFETGLIGEAAWTGKFISAKKPGDVSLSMSGAQWIWLREGAGFANSPAGDEYFRRTLSVSKEVKKAQIAFTADDKAVLYINGAQIASSAAWGSGVGADVTDKIAQGKNVIALKATNTSEGYAGALCKLRLEYADSTEEIVVTNSDWKASKSGSGDWFAKDFDDSSWAAPDQTENYGNNPWGNGVKVEKPGERTAPIFRKKFTAAKEVSRARAYVCGMGLYDFEINGVHADDSVLNPAHTDYDKSVLYNVYDITDKVTEGDNAVGVMVGHGFFNTVMPGWNWSSGPWKDDPMLRMEIVLDYADGSSDKIVTDDSWLYTLDGPIVEDDIYYGETYDARRTIEGYSKADFNDAEWKTVQYATAPKGALKYEDMEPMRRTESYKTEVSKNSDGSYIVKAPVVTAGWLNIRFNERQDTEITLTYGEKLDANKHLITKEDGGRTTQRDTYICNGTANEVYEPRFSYKGYQYVQIDGLENGITADDVIAYKVNNDVKINGSFNTSNTMINALHEMAVRTMLNNFQGKPTDTPFLEKNGWLGDANVALEMFNYNFGVNSFMKKFIGDMNDGQLADGDIRALVPIYDWGNLNTPVWNTIFINAAKELHNTYGNSQLIEQQYDRMRKLALKEIRESKSVSWTWYDDQLADWVAPMGGDANMAYRENPVEGSAICGTAYVYGALKSMAEFADMLGKEADAKEYRDAMASIYTAFNKKFYKKAKGIYETGRWDTSCAAKRTRYRQTSNLVPLAYGLVPDEYRQTVVDNLVKDIITKGYHLDTGMVGTKYILPVLAENGYADVAYKILVQDTFPSWGYWYKKGATTNHEMWEDTSRSLDHYFLGTYDEYLYKGIGGFGSITDGYKTLTVKPQLEGGLTSAEVSVETVRGTLENKWTVSADKKAVCNVKIPVGTTAKVVLPADSVTVNGEAAQIAKEGSCAVVTVGSGEYKFEFTMNTSEKSLDVTGVTLDKSEAELTEGDTLALAAQIAPDTALVRDVKWASSDKSVATVDASGVVTAVKAGEATVTATTADGGFKAECKVTVKTKPEPKPQPPVNAAVSGVSLNLAKKTLVKGGKITLTATVAPANAANKAVVWKSSNDKVAKVVNGAVTATGVGKATITASAGGKTASCTITVNPKKLKKLKVTVKKKVVTVKITKADKDKKAKTEVYYRKNGKKKYSKFAVTAKNSCKKKLKKGKYQIRARVYIVAGGKAYRSEYTRNFTVKVK